MIRRWGCIMLAFGLLPALFAVQQRAQVEQPGGIPLADAVLWADPGPVGSLDFRYGVGGKDLQPQPPFFFLDEDMSGTSPKVNVRDSAGRRWNVKWGPEARPSTFCTRLIWACGYVAEPEYFLDRGQIDGVKNLKRARGHVERDGSFIDARFQLRTDSPKYLEDTRWTWKDNPFVSTRELQGLKILMLLLSNWDTKDSNLRIFEDASVSPPRYFYAAIDWGASLGKWGNVVSREKWDCRGFFEQTPGFIKEVDDDGIEWGFEGKNRSEVASGISVGDVKWLLQYLGKITDRQIREGLQASGATPEQTECYAQALRHRIRQLEQAAEPRAAENR